MQVLVLDAAQVENLLHLDELFPALENAFKSITENQGSLPPRTAVDVPGKGFLGVMPGHLPGAEMAVKLVSVFEHNHDLGLPSHQAVIAVFDPSNGSPVCLMDGTLITGYRTAACSALATRLLARPDSSVLAIIGAGVQGRFHLELVPQVREFKEIRVASRDPEHAAQLAGRHPSARSVDSFEEAVRGADVVCLCTHSGQPVIEPFWLEPGTHVTSVGFAEPVGELDPRIARRGHLFVEGRVAFSPPPAGCRELEGMDPERGTELGEVLLGRRPGRTSDDEITVYKSMGHAAEDVATASAVYRRAASEHVGQRINL